MFSGADGYTRLSEKQGGRPQVVLWREAIAQSDLLATTRLVALTISLFFKSDVLEAWPSRTTLADRSGLSARTIDAHLPRLEAAGYLRVERSKGGALTPHRYFGLLPATVQVTPEPSTTAQASAENDADDFFGRAPAATEEVKNKKRREKSKPFPIGECEGCKEERPLVDVDVLYCEDCLPKLVLPA